MRTCKYHGLFSFLIFGLLGSSPVFSQFPSDATNLDENLVGNYSLPDVLRLPDGREVKRAAEWTNTRRPYIHRLFEENVYGKFPAAVPIHYRIRESAYALGGIAIRKQVRIYLKPNDSTVYTDVLIYLPKKRQGRVPVFLALNFNGNATINSDAGIFLSDKSALPSSGMMNADSSRGSKASRWSVDEMLANGMGLVTAWYGDFEEDRPDGWKTGIRTTLRDETKTAPEAWAAIGAWAWGLSRILDYLQMDKDINGKEVALLGHSRLGKAALWAGASDQRFAIVISNESGEGGAALARRWYGETVKKINNAFPHWFVARYKTYNDAVNRLPVDQHELLALIAPRPLYVASAEGDQWSDPHGEFLSAVQAGPVYALFGKRGLGTDQFPPLNHDIGVSIGYHIRAGKHDVTLYDWRQYIQFARRQWKLP